MSVEINAQLELLANLKDEKSQRHEVCPRETEHVPPITLIRQFLNSQQCQALMKEANCYPFERPKVKVYGKEHIIPRSQVWFGDNGCDYCYSGLRVVPLPWPKYAQKLKHKIMRELGGEYNSLLVNRYQNGHEYMGWHSDDEPELETHADIVSVTLGATRDFLLRHKESGQQHRVALADGDLLIMHAPMQQSWQHGLPKRLKVEQPRLNFTFRRIVPHFYA